MREREEKGKLLLSNKFLVFTKPYIGYHVLAAISRLTLLKAPVMIGK